MCLRNILYVEFGFRLVKLNKKEKSILMLLNTLKTNLSIAILLKFQFLIFLDYDFKGSLKMLSVLCL